MKEQKQPNTQEQNQELLDALEPEQRSQSRRVPLPQRELRQWESGLFWVLRCYVFVVLGLALMEFIRTVQHHGSL